jgi:hypothetical protein
MDCLYWLPNYVFTTYGYEITFDQPNLSADVHIEDFVTRMIIPELQAYVLIETDDTKDMIKDNIKKLFMAMTRQNDTCPVCFQDTNLLDNIVCDQCLNTVCANCFITQCLYDKGQRICPLCRFSTGIQRPNYERCIEGMVPFYVQQ